MNTQINGPIYTALSYQKHQSLLFGWHAHGDFKCNKTNVLIASWSIRMMKFQGFSQEQTAFQICQMWQIYVCICFEGIGKSVLDDGLNKYWLFTDFIIKM
jgi:hypothetical protein